MTDHDSTARPDNDGDSYGRAAGYDPEIGESAGQFRQGGQAGVGVPGAADEGYTGQTGSGYGRTLGGVAEADAALRDSVVARLIEDPFLDATHIEVSVAGGEVSLDGTVTARGDKRRAEDLAKAVEGVTQVHDALKVMDASAG
jgi:osmotically-inducible protein OsmY